ncbi:MAG: thioredoxin fold domain-containing protein [Bacteroidetes bacterium]|nr:thioredoxin fold domain-containing protein [Bacteroidota bacterium]
MKNIYTFALLLVISLFLGLKAANADEIAFEKGTFNEILKKAKEQNKIVMIDFITDWCIWCKHLDMRVYSNKAVVKYAEKHQINWKTDAEKEGKDLAKKYGVNSYPTLLFVDADGNEIDKIIGFYPAPDFLENIKKINERKSSLAYLQSNYNNNKTDLKANLDLANRLIAEGKADDAKKYLNYIIQTDVSNSQGYTDDAELLIAMMEVKDKTSEAYIKDVNILLEKYPKTNLSKDVKLFLSDKYTESKNDEMALLTLKGLYKKFPKDDMVKYYFGQYYLSKARKINSDTTSTEENYKLAVRDAKKSIPYFKGGIFEASAENVLADLYFKLGDSKKAKKSINRALELWSDNKTYNKTKDKIYGTK